jgi:hypothetical protein
MTAMHKKNLRSAVARIAGPRAVSSDRRSRVHLRDLCDEVLASFRLASGRDLFSDQDRSDARSFAPNLRPVTQE